MDDVAVISLACEFPDASSPTLLWNNVIEQRLSFRTLPPERFSLDDYFSADLNAPDATYATEAAVLSGYQFDRVSFKIPTSVLEATDWTHWLALDVASRALQAVGLSKLEQFYERTGVYVGNSLAGEFSRANLMRLRWPYVRRVLDDALKEIPWANGEGEEFLSRLEALYKRPFSALGEDSLAGGLSNTIAGRICNYYNFGGGGYVVDGACASSLLAVTTACGALATREVDTAIAGGVDLSLDPFELVGFAKASALARDTMWVYDRKSNGFFPGSGDQSCAPH